MRGSCQSNCSSSRARLTEPDIRRPNSCNASSDPEQAAYIHGRTGFWQVAAIAQFRTSRRALRPRHRCAAVIQFSRQASRSPSILDAPSAPRCPEYPGPRPAPRSRARTGLRRERAQALPDLHCSASKRRVPQHLEHRYPSGPRPRSAASQAQCCGTRRQLDPQPLAAAADRGGQARGRIADQDQRRRPARGSSSVLSSALAALAFIASAGSISADGRTAARGCSAPGALTAPAPDRRGCAWILERTPSTDEIRMLTRREHDGTRGIHRTGPARSSTMRPARRAARAAPRRHRAHRESAVPAESARAPAPGAGCSICGASQRQIDSRRPARSQIRQRRERGCEYLIGRSAGIEEPYASRIARGAFPVAGPHPLEKLCGPRPRSDQPVRRAQRARVRPSSHRQIEQQCAVRATDQDARRAPAARSAPRHAATAALIGAGCIGEAIADHPASPAASAGRIRFSTCTERAANISSVSALGADRLAAALEHQRADALGQRRAAGLARAASTSRPRSSSVLAQPCASGCSCPLPRYLRALMNRPRAHGCAVRSPWRVEMPIRCR